MDYEPRKKIMMIRSLENTSGLFGEAHEKTKSLSAILRATWYEQVGGEGYRQKKEGAEGKMAATKPGIVLIVCSTLKSSFQDWKQNVKLNFLIQ